MKTGKNLFLVLVPHRDIRLALRKYSADLLKTGIKDVCLFPQVAPLAALCAPLTKDELKHTARTIKENIMTVNEKGKIFTKETAAVSFPVNEKKTTLFGPRLDPVITRDLLIKIESVKKKLTDFLSTQVIGCFLTDTGTDIIAEENSISFPHELSFRSAAIANMYWIKHKDAPGWEWEIGELIWLPKSLKK